LVIRFARIVVVRVSRAIVSGFLVRLMFFVAPF
jgi:hypothetical protein